MARNHQLRLPLLLGSALTLFQLTLQGAQALNLVANPGIENMPANELSSKLQDCVLQERISNGCALDSVAAIDETITGDSGNAGAFTIRGIKGLWWSGIEKYQLALPWMAQHNMNFLMFCYTSWPASASDWRSDYTASQYQQFRDTAIQAANCNVALCHSFNPAIWSNPPLVYSSEQDYQLAWQKVRNVHSTGIRWFALCLDDINRTLQPEDLTSFGTLQAAQVYFVNRLWNDMKALAPRPTLIFCPSTYNTADAAAHQDYINAIGMGIDPEIMMFWTGPTVCSASITTADAEMFASWIRRKPFIWDNYPVNDMYNWRPFVGPLKNRSADLSGAVCGYLSNPMKQWYASTIPLATIAAYLNDPVNYNPTIAMNAVINSYPEDQRRAIELLVEIYGSSFWGEPGFPPGPLSTDTNLTEVLPKLEEIQQRFSTNPALANLWADVNEQVEHDLAMVYTTLYKQERWKTSPLKATGLDFLGGAGELFGYYYMGYPANCVYAIPTERDEMYVDFYLDKVPALGAVLRLIGLDDDYPEVCSIRISVNGITVMQGDSLFSRISFQEKIYEIPAGYLHAGLNRLSIQNKEQEGVIGMPPWFMITEAELIPKGFVRLPTTEEKVNLHSVVVTAAFPDCFYVESDDRCTGVLVNKTSHNMIAGARANVTGVLTVNGDGQQCIEASQVSASGIGTVVPLGINSAALGGGTKGLQQGISQMYGLNNIGLLVRVWGRLLTEDTAEGQFFIDDGGEQPIKCLLPIGATLNPSWHYVIVTGISSCERVETELHKVLKIRTQDDIRPVF